MRKKLIIICMLASILLVACGSSSSEIRTIHIDDGTTENQETENSEEIVEEVSHEGQYRSELTNEWISEDL